jgi:L-arabinose isomerase
MGHVLEAMLDLQTDPTAVTAAFGCHVVQCEADEILALYEDIGDSDDAVTKMKERILGFFDTPDPRTDPITRKLTEEDLTLSAKVAVALEVYIDTKNWTDWRIITKVGRIQRCVRW